MLSTCIDLTDGAASIELVYEVAGYFTLAPAAARKIAAEVERAVKPWRKVATKTGLRNAEMDRMASAFEHRRRHRLT